MKKLTRLIPSLFVCAALALAPLLTPPARGGAADAAPQERKFEFEYKATVRDVPPGAKRLELWIPVPHDTQFQKITGLRIDSPHPYKFRTAQYGNRVMHLG